MSEPGSIPAMLIAGVEIEALNLASALSSYSSESPTATTPVPLVNSPRAWPAVASHDTGSRNVHPSNSTTSSPPSVGPWSSAWAVTQSAGAVAVQSVPSPPDSLSETNGPSSRLLKSSANTRVEPGLSSTANCAALLVAEPAELLTTTEYEPESSSDTLDNSSTGPSAPAISTSPLNHL